MEYAVLGWPDDGPKLRLDHRQFSYAGKFVMSNTGKAVARAESEGDDETERTKSGSDEFVVDQYENDESRVVGAIAFNEDRTDSGAAWLRYVTVCDDWRGEGVGARLARFATERLRNRGYDRVRIAVNNPFAYHALYKAGFEFTEETTGIAELVLVAPADQTAESYRSGLDVFRARDDLEPEEREFLEAKATEGPPDVVAVPD